MFRLEAARGARIDVPHRAPPVMRGMERGPDYRDMPEMLTSGGKMPDIVLPRVGGGNVQIGGVRQAWQLLVVYRGRHCPHAKRYLARLNELAPRFTGQNTEILAVSADPRERAEADVQEFGWSFPVGYDLTIPSMRQLGAYISEPRSEHETDRPFAEPAIYLITPDGDAQIIGISNAPFIAPDLETLLSGINFIQSRNYPPRGTLG